MHTTRLILSIEGFFGHVNFKACSSVVVWIMIMLMLSKFLYNNIKTDMKHVLDVLECQTYIGLR